MKPYPLVVGGCNIRRNEAIPVKTPPYQEGKVMLLSTMERGMDLQISVEV